MARISPSLALSGYPKVSLVGAGASPAANFRNAQEHRNLSRPAAGALAHDTRANALC